MKQPWANTLSAEQLSIQTEDNTPYERPFKGDNNPTYPYDLMALSEANGGFDILKQRRRGTPWSSTSLWRPSPGSSWARMNSPTSWQ